MKECMIRVYLSEENEKELERLRESYREMGKERTIEQALECVILLGLNNDIKSKVDFVVGN